MEFYQKRQMKRRKFFLLPFFSELKKLYVMHNWHTYIVPQPAMEYNK